MKATHLRIWNYGDPYRPYKITAEDIFEISKGKRSIPSIPLTEQWLKDFGFEQFEDYEIYYKDNMPSDFQIDKTAEEQDEKGYWFFIDSYPINIVYVHQLQNLYFTLTGKELTK